MKAFLIASTVVWALATPGLGAESFSLDSAPPVVVESSPVAGSMAVNPSTTEIRVTFSKPMKDGSWSWSTWGQSTFPETTGSPRYLPDGRTCILPVSLKPSTFYAIWLNSQKHRNFTDRSGHSAVPYLLTFATAEE